MEIFPNKIYKEVDTIDLWTGSKLTLSVIDKYIVELLKVVELKDNTKFFPYGEIKYSKFIHHYFNAKLPDFKVSFNSKTIAVSSNGSSTVLIVLNYIRIMLTLNFSNLFLSYSRQLKGYLRRNPKIEISLPKTVIQFISLQANPDYIIYLIENNPEFYLEPETIQNIKNIDSHFLATFIVNQVDKNTLSIEPVFITKQIELTESQIEICLKKKEIQDNHARRMVESLNERHNTDDDFPQVWSDGSCVCCDQNPCICYD